MAAKYWIKLYHELLDDPKMGMLPDNVWRRAIELFLLAGRLSIDEEEEERGKLPSTHEIAWHLRMPEAQIEEELGQLEQVNIIMRHDDGWIVTKFANRQKAVSSRDRVREWRKRNPDKVKSNSKGNDLPTRIDNESVTNRYTEVEVDKESTTTTTNERDNAKKEKLDILAAKVSQNFSPLSDNPSDPFTCDFKKTIKTYGLDKVDEVVNLVLVDRANGERKSWKYVKVILEDKNGPRSTTQGKRTATRQTQGTRRRPKSNPARRPSLAASGAGQRVGKGILAGTGAR